MTHPYDPSYPTPNPNPDSPWFIPGWTSQNDLPGPLIVGTPTAPTYPVDLKTILITGTYIDIASGNPVQGNVTFRLDETLQDLLALTNIVPRVMRVPLVNGSISRSLVATDNLSLTKTGVCYHVVENIPGGRTFNMLVPSNTPNGVLDLSSVVDAPDFGGTVQIIGVPADGTGGQVLAKSTDTSYDSGWRSLTPGDVGFLVLDMNAPVPVGTPVGTIIVRKGT